MEIDSEAFFRLENKILDKGFLPNPHENQNIRFCVAHIILKAIALTKDPKADKVRVKELFDTASELLAFSDVKTDAEDKRLRDLIDAMIDGDDVIVSVRKIASKLEGHMTSLETKLLYKANLMQESLDTASENILTNQKMLGSNQNKRSAVKTFLILLVMCSTLLFAIIAGSVTIAMYLNSLSQPVVQGSFKNPRYGLLYPYALSKSNQD